MGGGGEALRDGQQCPLVPTAGSPGTLRGSLVQQFGGDASRALCPCSEVEGSGEGWRKRGVRLPIEGAGGGAYEALEFQEEGSLPGVCDGGEVSTCPILTGLPRAEVAVSEGRGAPDIRAEVGMGRCGSSNGSRASGAPRTPKRKSMPERMEGLRHCVASSRMAMEKWRVRGRSSMGPGQAVCVG